MRACALLPLVVACGQSPVRAQTAESAPLDGVAAWADAPGAPAFRDSTLIAARAALAAGRPWRATQLLAPVVREPARRTPAAVLLAAEAAAAWEGWDSATRLLSAEPWLDSAFGGRGRVLLARAALARSPRTPRSDSAALEQARRAVATAPTPRERGLRLGLVARAYDRLDQLDSARASYLAAAALLPDVSDWLRLRAAGVTPDSAQRRRTYAALRTGVARARAPWSEAASRERLGDAAGAQAAYAALGARVSALRLRLRLAADSAARGAVRRELVSLVEQRDGSEEARAAAELLDAAFRPLSAVEELAVARSAAVAGPAARATSGFAAAFARGLGTDRDRFTAAAVLSRLGRDREAAAGFARVRPPSALAGAAAYQRARSLLRDGKGDAATAALHAVVHGFPRDTAAAPLALYLLGDLATDAGRDAEARRTFLRLAREYPRSWLAAPARFKAAVIALVADSATAAARELESLVAAAPRGDEALAAGYWAGRAWAAVGDSARARARWREVATRDPVSYYAMTSARRLGARPWAPAAAADPLPRSSEVDSAMARAALLERLGMDTEARYEYDRLERDATLSGARTLATAAAFRDRGMTSPGIRLAGRALAAGGPRSAAVYRLLYPVAREDVLRAESAARKLDLALVAALIRQESNFTARATSAAGARGLMQVMPAVGQRIARALGYPFWDPVLLYQPDVNVQLGTAHLAGILGQYPAPEYALADYNAGGSRVRRWRAKPGTRDPELFVERIPYAETRDYVRIVLRNRELYRALYGW